MKARVLFTLKRAGKFHVPGTDSEVIDITEAEYKRIFHVVELMEVPTAPPGAPGWIPEEFPFQPLLKEAGVTTFDDLRKVDDLTTIKGIGKATAKRILAALEDVG